MKVIHFNGASFQTPVIKACMHLLRRPTAFSANKQQGQLSRKEKKVVQLWGEIEAMLERLKPHLVKWKGGWQVARPSYRMIKQSGLIPFERSRCKEIVRGRNRHILMDLSVYDS